VLVERPVPPGTEQDAVWWGYHDEQESWTWDAGPGQPMTVHVYTPGDSVRLLLNGAEVPGGAITPSNCVATFAVPYALGELAAVANGNPHNLDSFRQLDCERQRSPCLLLLLRVYGELDCLVLWQCLLLAPAFCTGLSALVIGGGVFEI
jgi:hypothetical protein